MNDIQVIYTIKDLRPVVFPPSRPDLRSFDARWLWQSHEKKGMLYHSACWYEHFRPVGQNIWRAYWTVYGEGSLLIPHSLADRLEEEDSQIIQVEWFQMPAVPAAYDFPKWSWQDLYHKRKS